MISKPKRREFVQLAKVYNPKKSDVSGWFVSEKLDGSRCFWDGGITRGIPTVDVPWAGITHPKTLERKSKIKPFATGLWSRYGNPIIAPDWFLDSLPKVPLDGELWCGRGNFQTSRSICAGDTPDSRWDQVKYAVYGSPPLHTFTSPGLIKSASAHIDIPESALQFAMERGSVFLKPGATFVDEIAELTKVMADCDPDVVFLHKQRQLTDDYDTSLVELADFMDEILGLGGEGVIVRNGEAEYACKRVADLLKFKPFSDMDGEVVGYTSGRGKYTGMMGALILKLDTGIRLELSGMTDAERELSQPPACDPGKDVPDSCEAVMFKRGDIVSFKYRELSDAGVPKEARFWRDRTGT